jgi:hypothetical protein
MPSRNPRQVSPARIDAAIALNRKLSRHFANIYNYPDYQELESIGLEAITACCVRVRSTRRHVGFQALCRVSIHNAVVNHVKQYGKRKQIIDRVSKHLDRMATPEICPNTAMS